MLQFYKFLNKYKKTCYANIKINSAQKNELAAEWLIEKN